MEMSGKKTNNGSVILVLATVISLLAGVAALIFGQSTAHRAVHAGENTVIDIYQRELGELKRQIRTIERDIIIGVSDDAAHAEKFAEVETQFKALELEMQLQLDDHQRRLGILEVDTKVHALNIAREDAEQWGFIRENTRFRRKAP